MLDALARRLIGAPLDRLARPLVRMGMTADGLTLVGLVLAVAVVPVLAWEAYGIAAGVIAVNRLLDGLDGAVARHTAPTDRGGFLDIACDFVFYGGVPLGFALARPENALPAAFLLFSFLGTGSTFLAYAAIAAKRGLSTRIRGRKSIYYLGGLAEGTETILVFLAACLFPDFFGVIAWGFGALCVATALGRLYAGWSDFRGR